MDQSDEEIMLDFQAGNQEGIGMIFDRYKNRILNFCLRILGNRADAEDVTADVFLALFSKRYRYDPNAKFSTWLFTVARNGCITRLRKKKNMVSIWFSNRESDTVDEWQVQDSQDNSRDVLRKKESASLIKGAIKKFALRTEGSDHTERVSQFKLRRNQSNP